MFQQYFLDKMFLKITLEYFICYIIWMYFQTIYPVIFPLKNIHYYFVKSLSKM